MSETKCMSCGCDCSSENTEETTQPQDEQSYREETHFAVLLALVPAMTMSLFNMMGLL